MMGRFAWIALIPPLVLAPSGCTVTPPVTDPTWQTTNVFRTNPMLLPMRDHELVWETVVDVVDDYFRIEREEPVRLAGNVYTEGRLDTYPAVASTLFEPWHRDSVGPYEKLESTLQSIRRRALVRVIPSPEGFWVDVAVFKELEDVARPSHATAGSATFRHDSSSARVASPVGEQDIHAGWIPMGRDMALEQQILQELAARATPIAAPLGAQAPLHLPPPPAL